MMIIQRGEQTLNTSHMNCVISSSKSRDINYARGRHELQIDLLLQQYCGMMCGRAGQEKRKSNSPVWWEGIKVFQGPTNTCPHLASVNPQGLLETKLETKLEFYQSEGGHGER